jgi:hypothetical protein
MKAAVVRVSIGSFDANEVAIAEAKLVESKAKLESGIRAMRGNLGFFRNPPRKRLNVEREYLGHRRGRQANRDISTDARFGRNIRCAWRSLSTAHSQSDDCLGLGIGAIACVQPAGTSVGSGSEAEIAVAAWCVKYDRETG